MPTFEQVLELEIAQATDAQAVEAIISKAEADIALLDSRRLTPDEMRERVQEIRDTTLAGVREPRKSAIERAKAAESVRRSFEPEAYRRAALREQAAIVGPLLPVLRSVPTHGLGAYLHDAVEAGNIALAEALRLEFQGRPDRTNHIEAFAATFAKLKAPEAEEARGRLARVATMANQIDVRISELMRGRRNAIARLDALRRGRAA